jgi:SAM-dependent methyltransferase
MKDRAEIYDDAIVGGGPCGLSAALAHDLAFAPPASPVEDQAFWDELYRRGHHHHHGPNRFLADDLAGLAPGTALDLGCGEGADARWLADHGWRVTAVDLSGVALAHARAADAAGLVDWHQADMATWRPPAEAFDLIKLHYVHVPLADRARLFTGLAPALRPGGTLLVVAHHPSDLGTSVGRPADVALYFTAEEIAALLPGDWTLREAGTRAVEVPDRDGRAITIRETVLKATRAPA